MAKEALLGVLRGKGRRAYEAAQKLLLEVHSLENALKLRFGMFYEMFSLTALQKGLRTWIGATA